MSDRGSNSAPHKKCLGCAYILEHLPENRCPECGRVFDPDDPLTFTSDDPSLALARSGTRLLTWACIGSLLTLFPLICMICSGGLGVLHPESPAFILFTCGFPVGFVIDVIVALRVSRASRRGCRSRSLTAAGRIAAGTLAVFLAFMILGSLIESIANRW